MNKVSKLVSNAIIEADYIIVYMSGKVYPVHPLAIHRLADAVSCISDLEFSDSVALKDMLLSARDYKVYTKALSWFIKGNQSLSAELSEGTFEEVLGALSSAFDLVGVTPFLKAASLTRNASLLAAGPRQSTTVPYWDK